MSSYRFASFVRAALPIGLRLVLGLALAGPGAAAEDAKAVRPPIDAPALDAKVRGLLAEQGEGAVAGLWLGGPRGDAWYGWEPTAVRPTASAIKTSFLVELFAKYADALDRSPAGVDDVLRDAHPAVAHFTPEQREEIRRGLSGATVRRIGGMMMGSVEATNLVYNAAANVVIALLGGPESLTKAIRARDPAFAPISVRRYMLADRTVNGDNDGTAAALAAVLQRVASGKIPGLDAETVAAVRRTLVVKDKPGQGRFHLKDGALNTDPITRVQSGWLETPQGNVVVFTVMTAAPNPGPLPRAEAAARLEKVCTQLAETLVKAALE